MCHIVKSHTYQISIIGNLLVVVHQTEISMVEVFYIDFLYLEDESRNRKELKLKLKLKLKSFLRSVI
jgi:hypothetical protein